MGAKLPTKVLPLPSSSGLPYVLFPVVERWDPLVLARMVEASARAEGAERLSAFELQVLHAAVLSQVNSPTQAQAQYSLVGEWIDIFDSVKNFVFVAFCDADAVVSAVGVVTAYIFNSKLQETIFTDARFLGVFKLLYGAAGSAAAEGGTGGEGRRGSR